VPSANFYERAQQDIDSTPSISLLQGLSVTEVNPNGRCIEVETSAGRINTYQVIDTRPPTHARCNEAPIKQVFYGLELRLNEPLQDPEIVRLMSQMSTDARGFKFQYLLPLSSDRVLLEVTRFSAASLPLATLKNEVYEAVKTTFPAGIGEIIRHEQGVIPMGLPLAGGTGDPRWVRAGTSAGAVRASSGYAFQRIQRWAKNGAAAFLKQHPVSQQTPITGTLAWMDSIFLETLRRNADLAPDLFMALARNVPADRLVRFLTDQPRVADLAAVIAALPARPMLKTLSKSRFATPKFLAGKTIE
jgi:lycopene beta-cyclase